MMKRLLLMAIVLQAPSAFADEPRTPSVVPPAPFPIAAPVTITPEEPVSESTALWLSLGGTAASYGALFAGSALGSRSQLAKGVGVVGGFAAIFAPTFGHWYQHSWGTRGLAVRLAALPIALVTLGVAVSAGTTAGDDVRRNFLIGGLSLAGGMWIAGTVDDIVQAPSAARQRNRRIKQLQPYLAPTGAGVTMRF